jgi:hypothetical protein
MPHRMVLLALILLEGLMQVDVDPKFNKQRVRKISEKPI